MSYFNHPEFDHHEKVIMLCDKASGLKAFLGIHRTVNGRAVGGTRIWHYESDELALQDVLRLSKAMSYKTAMAGLPIGGSKTVILKPSPDQDVSEDMLRAFGRQVEKLKGEHMAGKDVGCSDYHIGIIFEETQYAASIKPGLKENTSGNSGPPTALGNYLSIKAAVKHSLDRHDLKGLKIAVQGLGNVGYRLCERLHKDGVELYVTDIDQDLVKRAVQDFGAHAVPQKDIYAVDADIFAPCAMGAILNQDTIEQLKVKAVVGSANNQLARPDDALRLYEKGILYAPDYIVNSGGLINGKSEIFGQPYDKDTARRDVEKIYDTLLKVFQTAEADKMSPALTADKMADEILDS